VALSKKVVTFQDVPNVLKRVGGPPSCQVASSVVLEVDSCRSDVWEPRLRPCHSRGISTGARAKVLVSHLEKRGSWAARVISKKRNLVAPSNRRMSPMAAKSTQPRAVGRAGRIPGAAARNACEQCHACKPSSNTMRSRHDGCVARASAPAWGQARPLRARYLLRLSTGYLPER